jgi:transposase
MLADVVDAVVGGDTHRDSHSLHMVSHAGTAIGELTVPNSDTGFRQALDWITACSPGPNVVLSLEGTRSYGIGLARAAAAAGLPVVEAERPKRTEQPGQGKTDGIDARKAALSALAKDTGRLPVPRADGAREALRILLSGRGDIVRTRTARINALRALLLSGDDSDRALARGPLGAGQLAAIARRRGTSDATIDQAIRRAECRRLALAVKGSRAELADNKRQLRELVARITPGLLQRRGFGPVTAAQAIVSWSHPGRCRNDAAFAALAGVCPIPASSGRTVRHRLNRHGDRALNHAIHTIAVTRWRCCQRTKAYIARRRAEGKTDPEIRRCLKRYIAREIHRELTAAMS